MRLLKILRKKLSRSSSVHSLQLRSKSSLPVTDNKSSLRSCVSLCVQMRRALVLCLPHTATVIHGTSFKHGDSSPSPNSIKLSDWKVSSLKSSVLSYWTFLKPKECCTYELYREMEPMKFAPFYNISEFKVQIRHSHCRRTQPVRSDMSTTHKVFNDV